MISLFAAAEKIYEQVTSLMPHPRYTTRMDLTTSTDAEKFSPGASVQVQDNRSEPSRLCQYHIYTIDLSQITCTGHAERYGANIAHTIERQLSELAKKQKKKHAGA